MIIGTLCFSMCFLNWNSVSALKLHLGQGKELLDLVEQDLEEAMCIEN